jgi:hypothetical protein
MSYGIKRLLIEDTKEEFEVGSSQINSMKILTDENDIPKTIEIEDNRGILKLIPIATLRIEIELLEDN